MILILNKIDQIEISQESNKMILMVYKGKLYKLEADSKDYIEEWYKSIALVRSRSEEYLNLDRYVDMKVFEKISGKSLFRDFEEMLEEHFKNIEEIKRKKEEEENEIKRKLELEAQEKARKEAEKAKKEAEELKLQKKNKKKLKKTASEEYSPEIRLFKRKDVVKKQDSVLSDSDGSKSPYNETEVRLNDNDNDDADFHITLQHARSTVIDRPDDQVEFEEERVSELHLYRSNTETDLSNFKKQDAKHDELMNVYQRYSNVKQDSMFDLVKRHESISSGNSSDNKDDDKKVENKDNSGYSSSNMKSIGIAKKKIDPPKAVPAQKSIWGCFSCFKK